MKIADGEVSVWDFGGQLEYAVTHQLLLSSEVFSAATKKKKEKKNYQERQGNTYND